MSHISTPYELIPPGNPSPSNKEKFAEMRDYAAQMWREANGFEDIELQKLIKPKPKKVKTRFIGERKLYK